MQVLVVVALGLAALPCIGLIGLLVSTKEKK